MCGWGWLKFECLCSTSSSPALKCLSPAQNAFVSSTINAFVFYSDSGLEIHEKKQKLGNSFCKTSFQLKMDLKKGRNKEEMRATLHLLCVFADAE